MAKSAAERQKDFKERQRLHSQKQSVCYLLDSAIVDIVTSNAKQQNLSQSDYVNNALNSVVTSNETNKPSL